MPDSYQFNSDLVEDLARQRVVLFVGAGVSKSAIPNNEVPYKGWSEFLLGATSQVRQRSLKATIKKAIKEKDFLIASELLRQAFGEQWGELLSREYQRGASVSGLHKAIFELRQRIIVTTNFDKLLEKTWELETLERMPSVITNIDERAFKLFRDNNQYIIKLHGTIDQPEDVVFDKSSYQRDAFSNLFYNTLINTLLLTHTFLFLGFSMDDPAISLLLETHSYRYQTARPHYIFAPGPVNEHLDQLSRQLRKLFVLRYHPENNHRQLIEMLQALVSAANAKRRELFAATAN